MKRLNPDSRQRAMRDKLRRGLILLLSLAAVGYALRLTEFGLLFDRDWMDRVVVDRGAWGASGFVLIALLCIAIGIPRQIFCFLAGYAYGFTLGLVLALVATSLGCVASFYYARWLGGAAMRARLGARWRKFNQLLERHPYSSTLVVRLIPITNNLLVNLAAGLSAVRAMPYFLSSIVGFVPQTLVFVLVGTGVHVDHQWQLLLAVALFVASAALGLAVYRRYRATPALAAVADNPSGKSR